MTHFPDLPLDDRLCLLVLFTFDTPTIGPAELKALFSTVQATATPATLRRSMTPPSFEAVRERLVHLAPPAQITKRYISRRKHWFGIGPPAITALVHRISDPTIRGEIAQALAHDDDFRRLARLMLAQALDEGWVVAPTRPLHARIETVGDNRHFVRPYEADDPQALMERVCADIPDNHILDASLKLLARHPSLADDLIVDRLEALSRRTEEHIPHGLATHLAPVSQDLPASVTLLLLRLGWHTSENIGAALKPIAELILERHDAMTEPAKDLARRAFERIIAEGDPRPAGAICAQIGQCLKTGAFNCALLATYPEVLGSLVLSGNERTRGWVADVLHAVPHASHPELARVRAHVERDPSSYVHDCLHHGQLTASGMTD
jgi:hypothetical protein